MRVTYQEYLFVRDDQGKSVKVYDPCVAVDMKEKELDKFHKMMDYIETKGVIHPWDIEGDDEELLTAHVYVKDEKEGFEFIEHYKTAKKEAK